MAILFDDATDAGTLQSLQGKTAELAVTAQSTLQREHTANGQHTNITVTSIRSRTGEVVPVSAGVRWTGGPALLAPPAVLTPPALTATTHNWNPQGLASARAIEILATGAVSLTGIAVTGQLRSERRLLTLVNRSAFDISLPSLSASSHEAHQFDFGGAGTAYVLKAGTTVDDLYYDPGNTVWRGPSQATGGGGAVTRIGAVGLTIDGGGSAITTGVKGDVYIPFACTITASTLIADVTGSVVLDLLLSSSYATTPTVSIVAGAPPTLSSALTAQDATLTGWTVAVAAGSRLRYSVSSASTITRLTHTLTVQAT